MNAGACWEYRTGRKSVFRGVADWNFWTMDAGSFSFIGGESSSGRAGVAVQYYDLWIPAFA